MPALPPVPQVLRITMEGDLGEDTHCVNRWYLPYSGTPPTSAQLVTFASDILLAWGANMSPLQAPRYATSRCTVEDLTSDTAAVGSYDAVNTGTRPGNPMGPSECFCLRFSVPRRYRGGHSRMYLYAGTQSDLVNPQQWNGAFVTAVETGWVNFLAGFVASPWTGATIGTQVAVSYYQGFTNVLYPSGRYRAKPTLRDTPLVLTLDGITGNPNVASQRRRNLQGS